MEAEAATKEVVAAADTVVATSTDDDYLAEIVQ